MRINHRFRDRKTETKTAKTPGDGDLALFEGIENFVDLFRFDPNASIADSDFNLLRRRVNGFNNDTAFLRGEFHAVLDEIPKHLLQTRRISFDIGLSGAEPKFHLKILGGDVVAANLVSALQDFMDANNFKPNS